MKYIIYILILTFFGCSPRINKYYSNNKYIRNYSIHILNDSLKLHFKTPADITYIKDKKKLKKIIRNRKYKIKDSVLVYGITNEPPYEYFITVSKNKRQTPVDNLIIYDTVVNDMNISFIGNSLSDNSEISLKIDLKNIFESLIIGNGYRENISSVMEVVNRYKKSNAFYAALNEIKEYPSYDKQSKWTKLQMALTFSSFLGNNQYYKEYIKQLEKRFKPNEKYINIIKGYSVVNSVAIDKIIKEAENHQIIMINENHFFPNHRLFVIDLLPKLKKIGYNTIALEALDIKQDSLLNLEKSYPTLKTGFYTSEQNYSNLIRLAKSLGFKFVSYENMDNTKNREIEQANNLYNKTFKINPNQKVIVLAGIDHILENPTKNGKSWMASIFKEKYNINPLTISQTHLNSYRFEFNDNQYTLIEGNYFDNSRLSSVDFHLLNRKTKNNEWDAYVNYKNPYNLEIQILLFYENEINYKYDYHNKIPYFTTILKEKEQIKLPVYKDKNIYLYIYDNNGKTMKKELVTPANNVYKSLGDKCLN